MFCYSGGTKSTALFKKIAETLQNTGFQIKIISEGGNQFIVLNIQIMNILFIGFSKKLDDDFNPKTKFAAIMTCSHTDGGCPFVVGAEKRIPITYIDPKEFDNTPLQTEKYNERSIQITTELFHVFPQINS